jgi:hypothetical protein
VFRGRDPGRPSPMNRPRSLLCLRSLLWVALSSAACLADDPDELLEDHEADEGEVAPTWRPLVRNGAWQPSAAEDDPLAEHRPATVECEEGWGPEADGIEIDTGACNYLSLEQPLMEALEPGDPLRLQLWWQSLASVDPAEGHLAIYVDDELLWEELVPIPGPAAVRNVDFESPLGAPAGATLTLHLHNHGYNTWHFHELNAFGSGS